MEEPNLVSGDMGSDISAEVQVQYKDEMSEVHMTVSAYAKGLMWERPDACVEGKRAGASVLGCRRRGGSTVGDIGREVTRGQSVHSLAGHVEEFGLYYKSNGKPQQV